MGICRAMIYQHITTLPASKPIEITLSSEAIYNLLCFVILNACIVFDETPM
jgi:hypothetical protein